MRKLEKGPDFLGVCPCCRRNKNHWDGRPFFISSSSNTEPGKREHTIKKSSVQKTISDPSS